MEKSYILCSRYILLKVDKWENVRFNSNFTLKYRTPKCLRVKTAALKHICTQTFRHQNGGFKTSAPKRLRLNVGANSSTTKSNSAVSSFREKFVSCGSYLIE